MRWINFLICCFTSVSYRHILNGEPIRKNNSTSLGLLMLKLSSKPYDQVVRSAESYGAAIDLNLLGSPPTDKEDRT